MSDEGLAKRRSGRSDQALLDFWNDAHGGARGTFRNDRDKWKCQNLVIQTKMEATSETLS